MNMVEAVAGLATDVPAWASWAGCFLITRKSWCLCFALAGACYESNAQSQLREYISPSARRPIHIRPEEQGRHFGVGPLKAKIMTVEGACDDRAFECQCVMREL